MISTSTSPARGPSRSTSWTSSGRLGATAIAALVFIFAFLAPGLVPELDPGLRRGAAPFNRRQGVAADRPKMPRTVWALGFVSLFMDLSSETIHALLPLFLTTTLGASVAVVGVIDGI